ncbi:MAG: hypothetical protein LBR21_02015 [Propionibacteriaceae bacterium]|jgi:hypothetical protein|nr:hypothetical protein [Propionibacteriaceae bacterium]
MTITTFRIDPMRPQSTGFCDPEDTLLSEAIYTAFPDETEDAVMTWGEEKIRLSYRYDIAYILHEIFEMAEVMTGSGEGQLEVCWPSNSFAGQWFIQWHDDALSISTEWREEFCASQYLIDNNHLETSKKAYLGDWGKVLRTALSGLTECGYSAENLTDFDALPRAINMLSTGSE